MGFVHQGLRKMLTISVIDFTEFPGPRHESIGKFSGERFREEVLLENIKKHSISEISIDLDGTAGYGSSFLEEAFGGLIRKGIPYKDVLSLCNRITSDEDPSLIEEIKGYVRDESEKQGS
jgi:hypothetical protein